MSNKNTFLFIYLFSKTHKIMSLFLDVFESKQIKSTMEFLIEIYLSNTNKKK